MNISYENIGQVCATFACDETVQVGDICTLSKSGTVTRCDAEHPVFGKILTIRNGIANVAVGGFVTLPYSTLPTVGYHGLSADAEGKLAINEDMPKRAVVALDVIGKTATVLL